MGMEVLADFEQGYGSWRAEGNCFGGAPATGSIGNQHPVPGFTGKALVNTFLGGDGTTGTLTSPAFSLTKDWLWYWPPGEMTERLAAYANAHGQPTGWPYYSLDGERPVTATCRSEVTSTPWVTALA